MYLEGVTLSGRSRMNNSVLYRRRYSKRSEKFTIIFFFSEDFGVFLFTYCVFLFYITLLPCDNIPYVAK